jgi:hypothetical protein
VILIWRSISDVQNSRGLSELIHVVSTKEVLSSRVKGAAASERRATRLRGVTELRWTYSFSFADSVRMNIYHLVAKNKSFSERIFKSAGAAISNAVGQGVNRR